MKYIELFKNGFDSTIDEKIKPENWPYIGYSPNEGFAFAAIPDGGIDGSEATLAGRTFPNNVIAYISADGNPIEFSGSSFNETCTEHIFDSNTKIGQWIFDQDLTKLGSLPNLTLKELSLPESITILRSTRRGATTSKIFYNTTCNKLYYNCISAQWDTNPSYTDKGFQSGKINSIIIGPNTETIPILYNSMGDVMPNTLEINTLHNIDITNLATLRSHVSTIKVTTKNIYLDSRDDCNAIIDSATNELLVGCSNTIIPNSVVTVGEKAFYFCELQKLIIPDSVTLVRSSAFQGSSIEYVKLSNGMTNTGESTFKGCANLRTIDFGSNIIAIGRSSFSNTGLEQLVLPDTVRSIQPNAFESCSNLTHLTFGHDTTKIDSRALAWCDKLENIYYNGTKTEWYAVEKCIQENYEWYYQIPATVVHCIDGDVPL